MRSIMLTWGKIGDFYFQHPTKLLKVADFTLHTSRWRLIQQLLPSTRNTESVAFGSWTLAARTVRVQCPFLKPQDAPSSSLNRLSSQGRRHSPFSVSGLWDADLALTFISEILSSLCGTQRVFCSMSLGALLRDPGPNLYTHDRKWTVPNVGHNFTGRVFMEMSAPVVAKHQLSF